MLQVTLLVVRLIMMTYLFILLIQCTVVLFRRKKRGEKKMDQRNVTMYVLVIAFFFLTDTQLAVNIWGSQVAGTDARTCKTWRGISVILYPLCMTPVTVLLWSRQRFFYKLNMVKRSASKCLRCLSSFIIYPALMIFGALIIFFIFLYFSSYFDIMDYKIENGFCISGKSSRFSAVFRVFGLLAIIALHCILLYLFIYPLKQNMKSQASSAGRIMEAKGSRKIPEEGICASVGAKEQRGHFKSIKDLDHALIRKLAVITGVVIAADVFCIAVYVLLKKLEVELSSQQLALDIQVVITSISNVMCWKHWREIILPTQWIICCHPKPKNRVSVSSNSVQGRPVVLQDNGKKKRLRSYTAVPTQHQTPNQSDELNSSSSQNRLIRMNSVR